jgi:hypothetical protein
MSSNSSNAQLDEIWQRIDLADAMEVPQRAKELNSAIADLHVLVADGNLPAWYPLGYAYYCHPNRRNPGSQERIETVNSLLMAVSHHIEEPLANLYLAHHYYDLAEYETADIFAREVGELKSWIKTKHWELLLCIQLHQRGIARSRPAIDEYASRIEGLGEWEPEPVNLFFALEACLAKEEHSAEVSAALERLDAAFPNFAGVFETRFRDLMQRDVE